MLNANYNAGSSRSTEVREVFETWILSLSFFYFMFCNRCTTVTYCMNIKQEKRTSIDKLFPLQHERWQTRVMGIISTVGMCLDDTASWREVRRMEQQEADSLGNYTEIWMLKRELNIPEKNTEGGRVLSHSKVLVLQLFEAIICTSITAKPQVEMLHPH